MIFTTFKFDQLLGNKHYTLSVFDYVLCIAWVICPQTTRSAHCKAVLDDSCLTVDTTSLHQHKLYYYTNSIITIARICHIVKVNSTSCGIQWLHSLNSVGLALFVIREFCLRLRKKYLDLSNEYRFN